MVEKELDEACLELTGQLLSKRGGIKALSDFLGKPYKDVERLKNGKHPNKWFVYYIKLRAAVSVFARKVE